MVICAVTVSVGTAWADEIRLKDGKKLYGVIVAYEDNMFKVKTDFGFVLVEKDKIASIVPSAPDGHATTKSESQDAKKATPAKPELGAPKPPAKRTSPENPSPASAPADAKSAASPGTGKEQESEKTDSQKASTVSAAAPVSHPRSDAVSSTDDPSPRPHKTNAAPPSVSATPPIATPMAAPTAPGIPMVTALQPAKPKPAEPPPNRESLQGNAYINYTHGFRMYKPPSWKLIEDARKSMPNAIMAMGTANESTILVVGQEKTKDPLEVASTEVEKRLRDTYGNYRRISQRKTVAGGFPAVEIHYRGLADDHDWSGTLLVVARGEDIFSVLGMTYSDTDLIQIQENVISRAIASLEFNSN
jgi:hypothetical protein